MSTTSHGAYSTHLASSVFQSVRIKLNQFKLEVSEKGQRIQQLQEELKLSESKHMEHASASVTRQQVISLVIMTNTSF